MGQIDRSGSMHSTQTVDRNLDANQRGALPIACTLGPDDGRPRLLRWQRLHERAAPIASFDGGCLEVRYTSAPGVREELAELVAAEQRCCSFAEWNVSTVDGNPVLRITAEPDALLPIANLFDAAARDSQ